MLDNVIETDSPAPTRCRMGDLVLLDASASEVIFGTGSIFAVLFSGELISDGLSDLGNSPKSIESINRAISDGPLILSEDLRVIISGGGWLGLVAFGLFFGDCAET